MAQQQATYKGRTYNLLWQGATKYGQRAKLSFLDGSKEFWVDASLVSTGSAPSTKATKVRSNNRRSRGTWTGCSCGSVEEYEKASDCFSCKRDRW